MSFFNQMKVAQDMMKNMSPDEIKQLMEQAKEHKSMLDDQVKQLLDEEIKKRNLVTREEVEKLVAEGKSP